MLKREYLNYVKWTEPVALMLALVGEEAQALRVVRLALEVDGMLGARLAGEVGRGLQEQTVGMVSGLDVPQWLKVELWGKTRSDFAVEGLVRALEDENSDMRKRTVEVLGKLGSQDAIPGLLSVLEDENSWVRSNAVEALGKLGSEAAIPSLLQALKDKNSDVRIRAAEALGKLSSQKAIPGLIQALDDKDFWVRQSAAEALGKLDSQAAAIPGWLQALEHQDSWVRQSLVKARGKAASKAPIPGFQALEHQDPFVRWRAVEALGNLGSQAAIPSLLQTLEDENSNVRSSAVKGLGKLKNDRAAHILPNLRTLIPTESGKDAFRALTAIQANCKFYNYDIFRSPPIPKPSPNSSQPSSVYNIHNPEAVTIVEKNDGEVITKQISKAE